MATKAKESSAVGKEKAPSSNSPITSTTKRTPKPSSTATTSTNSTDKATSNPSEKQIPNYLKPTISSRLESHSHSFKLPKSDGSNNKAILNRRRSFDKPISPSGVQLKKQPSPSRQHKALVSPGPRERSLTLRSSIGPIKSNINHSNKPISERASKTNKEGKTQPIVASKSAKKSSTSVSTSTTKKVANDNASANNSTNTAKDTVAETIEKVNVQSEPEVKEAINEEVVKVENQENGVENVSEIPPHVEPEHQHDDHEHDQKPEESDQPQIQGEDEKVIPTVSEEEKEAAKEEPREEKIEDEKKNEEGENNTNQDESNNNNESHPEELNHSTTEEEVVEVKEKEEEEEEEEEEEGGVKVIAEEDHKSEINNNKEEEAVEEVEEGVEGGKSEAQEEQEHVENEVKEAKEENKAESTKPKQEAHVLMHGKKEAQVSNGVIEETASKLLEERQNKVKALAGAFQSVIDCQTK